MRHVRNILGMLTLFLGLLLAQPAMAQDQYVRIQNVANPADELNVEQGLASSPAGEGWHSAMWYLEDAGIDGYYLLRNRWTGEYLGLSDQGLFMALVEPAEDMHWAIERVGGSDYARLKNGRNGAYLHAENGYLDASAINWGWQSAMWNITVFGGAPVEEVDYRVMIDNCHSDLDNTETSDTITLRVYDESGRQIHMDWVDGSAGCGFGTSGETEFTFSTAEIIGWFELETNGEDGYFMDSVKMTANGRTFGLGGADSWSGRNGGNGWCLSTDPADADGQWANNLANGCQQIQRFPS